MKDKKKIFLLDAYALIFRAYYAFIKNPRFNSKGLNTSAILGFVNTLDEIIKKEKPTHIAVVFDFPAANFRHQLYPQYKGNRPPTPEDIKISTPYIKEIIAAFNIPIIEIEGYEADDAIGTLAKIAEKHDFQVFMMTSDKDYIQLVSENIAIYRPKHSGKEVEIVDLQYVKNIYGLNSPLQFIDVLALWGDTSDNVPGVKNVGEKTAYKLIADFGSIENIYKNLFKLKGKLKDNLIEGKSLLSLSKELVTIKTDIDIPFDEEEFRLKEYNKEKLIQLFDELEFRAAAVRILQTNTLNESSNIDKTESNQNNEENIPEQKEYKTIENNPHNYFVIDNPEKRSELIKNLETISEFCFDTETTSLNPYNCEIVGLSISYKANEAYYIPFNKDQPETKNLLSEFKHIFENQSIRKIGQNIKFDIIVLKQYDIFVHGQLFDTMIAHYLLEPEQKHNMDFLAEIYLGYKPVTIESLIGEKGKNQGNMRDVAIEQISLYAAEDADVTFQLKEIFEPLLQKNNLNKLASEIEMPLIHVLADMEFTGIKLDSDFLNKYQKVLSDKIVEVEKEIIEISGENFNVSSPKQLGEVLFDKMKIIPNAKKTKTQQYSTSEEELQKIADKHIIIQKILTFRTLKKLLNTYVEVLPTLVNPKTNRLHTSYNQAIAATGRLTSNNPNLQNIPIRSEEGKEIRRAFIADEDSIIIDADYSQIELRLMAELSKDENMIEAFRNSEDIHTATASKIFKVDLKDVTKDMRYKAKSANFAIIYGASAFGLSTNLSISRTDAKYLIDSYFETYPKVKEYMDNSIKIAREHEFVTTIKGRKRKLPDINSRNHVVRGNAERNAINAPIQGSAADVIKIAMINIFNRLKFENLKSKMLLQVHDELLIEAKKDEVDKVKKILSEEMQNAIQISVPLVVDMNTGSNWFEAH